MSGLEKLEDRSGLITAGAGGAGQALGGAFSDAGFRVFLTEIAATGVQLGVGTAARDATELQALQPGARCSTVREDRVGGTEYDEVLRDGRRLLEDSNWPEATARLRRAVELAPEFAGGHYWLGVALSGQRSWEEAVVAFERALESDPQDPAIHRALGDALSQLERWERAANTYAQVIELGAASYEAWFGLGYALFALSRWDDANSALQAAIEIDAERPSAHLQLGILSSSLKRWDSAVQSLRKAAELSPDSHDPQYHLGCALFMQQQWEPARAAFQRAIDLSGESPEAQFRLGRSLSKLGCWEDAIAAYRRAVELDPAWSPPHKELGDSFAKLEEWDAAVSSYLSYVQMKQTEHEGEDISRYFGGFAHTAIMEIVSAPRHTVAYFQLARRLEEAGQASAANFARERIRDLVSEPAGRPGIRNELGRSPGNDSEARSKPIPRRAADGTAYLTDKITDNSENLGRYEEFFARFVGKPITLLELGVFRGGSLLMWRDYFEKGTIVGLDVNEIDIADPTGRVHLYQGYQEDTALLDRIAVEAAPSGYDIIIDDASHRGDLTRLSFDYLFEYHLKHGGVYVIEDWESGYLDDWPDGNAWVAQPDILELTDSGQTKRRLPSHDFGQVGFVKQLIDRIRSVERLVIAAGQVFILKKTL